MSNGEISIDGSTSSNVVNLDHENQFDEEQSEDQHSIYCSETDGNRDSEIDMKDNFDGQHNTLAPHLISNNHCPTTLMDDFGCIDVYSTEFGKNCYSDDESSDVSACANLDNEVSSSDDSNQNAYSGNSYLEPEDASSEICSDVICLPYAHNTQLTMASDFCAKQVFDSNDSSFLLADSESKNGYEKLPSPASTDTKNSLATFSSSCHQTSQVSVCQDTNMLPAVSESIGLDPENDAASCLHLPVRQPSPCRMSPGVARRLVVKPPAQTSDAVQVSFAEKATKVEVAELAQTGIAANFSMDELVLKKNELAAKDANSLTVDGVGFVTLDTDQNSGDFTRSESISARQKDIENEYDYVKYSRTLKPAAPVALSDHHPDVSQDSGDLMNDAHVAQLSEASVCCGNTVMDECSNQRHLQSLGLAAVKSQSRVKLPLVEDGLSSGETDDNEDEGENEVYTCKVMKLSHPKPVYDNQCEELPKHVDNSEVTKRRENNIGLNDQITCYEKEQTKSEQSHIVQVERAIQDIRSAIQQSKSLSMVQPANDELTSVTKEDSQPVWITRSPRGALARRPATTAVNTGDQRESGYPCDDDVDDDDEGCGPLLTRNLKVTNSNRTVSTERKDYSDTDEETNELLSKRSVDTESVSPAHSTSQHNGQQAKSREVSFRDPTNDTVLIQGVLFRVSYLGSTQLISEGQPTKAVRMNQAQEAVNRVKAPEGENQPSTDVDLFISVEKIMVLNTDIQEIIMDHALRTISYIADIGDLLVIMARRGPVLSSDCDDHDGVTPHRKAQTKICCHVFETEEAQLVAQSIGQAFHVAYIEYLKANGIESPSHHPNDVNYQEVLSQQEIFGEELSLFANKDMQKEVIVPKLRGEVLGLVIVESGWGSMLPTVVIANLSPTGAAARCGQLNIGDQIISVNGVSLVGLALSTCQNYIKATRNQTVAKLVVVSCSPVVEVLIKRPDIKYQLGFSVQNGIICSLLRGGIAERGGVRVGHRIIDINGSSVVATPHERIVKMLASAVGEIHMKTMPMSIFRLLTGQDVPHYI